MLAIPYVAFAALAASLCGVTVAAPSPTVNHVDEFVRRDAEAPPFVKRAASCTFPTPPKTSSLSAPITVTGTFDGTRTIFCMEFSLGTNARLLKVEMSGSTVVPVPAMAKLRGETLTLSSWFSPEARCSMYYEIILSVSYSMFALVTGTSLLEQIRPKVSTALALATSTTSGSRMFVRTLSPSSRPLDSPTLLVVALRRRATRLCSTMAAEP